MHFKCKVSFSWCQKTTNKGELSNFPAIFSHSPSLEHCHLHGIISCKLQTLSRACCRGKPASFLLYWLLFKWLTAALKGRGGNLFCVSVCWLSYIQPLKTYCITTCEERVRNWSLAGDAVSTAGHDYPWTAANLAGTHHPHNALKWCRQWMWVE